MSFNKEVNELIEDFSYFESWEDKYQYLIDLGRSVPKMDENLKIDKNKLKGCQSVVYFSNFFNDNGTITFIANSEWEIIDLPFSKFKHRFSNKPLDGNDIRTFGIVAYGRNFISDVSVSEVSFYY